MRRGLAVFILYTVFFGALFLQFPLKNSLPGNCDSWLLISLSNQYLLKIDELVTGERYGRAMYPIENLHAYGESTPGCCAMFLLLKLFGLSDLWTYYLYLTAIFALTAFAVYRFATLFMPGRAGPIFAGFAFTCSNMAFAHIDDSIIYFYALPLTAAYLLVRHLRERRGRYLWAAAAVGGLEVYFSLYVFIYQTLLLAAILLYQRLKKEPLPSLREAAAALALYGGLAIPYFLFYLFVVTRLHVIDPFGLLYTARMTSLMPFDFIAALPENPIYGGLVDLPQNWGFVRHRNLIGLLVTALGVYGLLRWNRDRRLFLLIAAFGFVFALGPNLMYHPQAEFLPPAPLYPFYTWIPVLSYMRVTNRAYFLVLLALSLCAGLSLDRLVRLLIGKKRAAAYAVIAAVFIVHGVENIPIPFKAWPVARYIELPDDYARFVATTAPNEVFMDLPSHFNMQVENWDPAVFDDPLRFIRREPGQPRLEVSEISMFTSSWDNLFQYNRELIYMQWQSLHRRSTVSGLNGYFPTPRMLYYQHGERLPEPEAVGWLARRGVTAIVYHKGMELKKDRVGLSMLEGSPLLEKVFDSPTLAAFRFRRSQ